MSLVKNIAFVGLLATNLASLCFVGEVFADEILSREIPAEVKESVSKLAKENLPEAVRDYSFFHSLPFHIKYENIFAIPKICRKYGYTMMHYPMKFAMAFGAVDEFPLWRSLYYCEYMTYHSKHYQECRNHYYDRDEEIKRDNEASSKLTFIKARAFYMATNKLGFYFPDTDEDFFDLFLSHKDVCEAMDKHAHEILSSEGLARSMDKLNDWRGIIFGYLHSGISMAKEDGERCVLVDPFEEFSPLDFPRYWNRVYLDLMKNTL